MPYLPKEEGATKRGNNNALPDEEAQGQEDKQSRLR